MTRIRSQDTLSHFDTIKASFGATTNNVNTNQRAMFENARGQQLEDNFSLLYRYFEKQSSKQIAYSEFNTLVEKRLEYLDSLHTLGDGWIGPGVSKAPSSIAINIAKQVLKACSEHTISNRSSIPELIMSPTPVGGIGIEFEKTQCDVMYVSIKNNGDIGVELMINDRFSEEEIIKDVDKVVEKYELFIKG
ncbi:MAG: hypothetical protein P1P64_07435 [Treponemataceae bacterium]